MTHKGREIDAQIVTIISTHDSKFKKFRLLHRTVVQDLRGNVSNNFFLNSDVMKFTTLGSESISLSF